MALISKETWDKFTEEEKENIRAKYRDYQEEANDDPFFDGASGSMETVFGLLNLQSKIRTWEDVEKMRPECKKDVSLMAETLDYVSAEVYGKILATYKIAKLIELGYGGIVTEEEWTNDKIEKYYIVPTINGKNKEIEVINSFAYEDKHFISFHTKQQAKEFMSHSKNIDLVYNYYIIEKPIK